MSKLLSALENEVQIGALLFMAVVYAFRLIWIFRFKSGRERTTAAGSEAAGIGHSLMNIAMPWAMESTRKKPSFYAQFVSFHLGVAAAIAATFIIPYRPALFEIKAVARVFQVIMAAAFLVGLLRLIRRLTNPVVRLISTADDYLSLTLMILFFAAGILAVPNNYRTAAWTLILFFGLTAFFLMYVPFSKICHYLYYPFTHYFLGRTLGHRGAMPPGRKGKGRGLPASPGGGGSR
jgi:nitrate reductase gamma subunit